MVFLISSKDSISFDTPPPKTIASGSITLIIKDKLLASFFLNSSIISISSWLLSFAFLKILCAERFLLNLAVNFLSKPLPEIYSSMLVSLSGFPMGIWPHSPVNEFGPIIIFLSITNPPPHPDPKIIPKTVLKFFADPSKASDKAKQFASFSQ